MAPPHEDHEEDDMEQEEEEEMEQQDEAPPLVFQLLRPGVHGAALVGPEGSGKSSLAFQAAYALAGQHPERQAVFIHCRKDGRDVATAVRRVVGGGGAETRQHQRLRQQSSTAEEGEEAAGEDEDKEEEEEDGGGGWDNGALENVYLKRFTTAQHLLWYLGSLHNQPDALLPGALIIDDLHRFPSSAGHDLPTAASRVLSLLRDAADHIQARTGRPCWTLVTMEAGGAAATAAAEGGGGSGGQQQHYHQQQQEYAVRRLVPAFVRQLGAVLRLRHDRNYRGGGRLSAVPSLSLTPSSGLSPWGQQGQGPQGQQAVVVVLEEDPGAAKLAQHVVVAGPAEGEEDAAARPSGPCRFLLGPRVLRVMDQ